MKLAKSFTIDRARWCSGKLSSDEDGNNNSRLYRSSDKRMCCLGFYARECGFKVVEIKNKCDPKEVFREPNWLVESNWPDGSYICNRPVAFRLMDLNDDASLSPRARELRIKAIFAENGVKVKFVGRTPKPSTPK